MAKEKEEQPKRELSEEEKELSDDLGKIAAIEALSLSEGGKLLLDGLVSDVVGIVDSLANKYSELDLPRFIAYCAEIKTKLDMARAISRSKKNKDYLQDLLEEKLKE